MGFFEDKKQKAFDDRYDVIMNSLHLENLPTDADKRHLENAVTWYVNGLQAKYADEKTLAFSAAAVEQNFILISMLDEVLHQLLN